MTTHQIVLACNFAAIPANEREAHSQSASALLATVQEVKTITDGYAFRLPNTALLPLADFIDKERLCCPFFSFTVAVEANQGAIWLQVAILGHEEAKVFIAAEFGGHIDTVIAQQAGLR